MNPMSLTLFAVSLVGGFLSGLLGIGGAVILIPLLLSVPPLVGCGELSMAEATAISIVQVLVASGAGCLSHKKGGNVHTGVLFSVGIPMGVCSLAGAFFSAYFSEIVLKLVFGALVIIAFWLLLNKSDANKDDPEGNEFEYKPILSILVGGSVGFAAGIVGAGGGFILIPLMIAVLNIPVRMTVGSSLGIVFIGALLGSIGKFLSGQIPYHFVLPVLLGCLPAARFGAWTSQRLSVTTLKRILLGLVGFSMLRTWVDIARQWLAS